MHESARVWHGCTHAYRAAQRKKIKKKSSPPPTPQATPVAHIMDESDALPLEPLIEDVPGKLELDVSFLYEKVEAYSVYLTNRCGG